MIRNWHGGWMVKGLAMVAVVLSLVGLVLAQAQPRPGRGRVRNPGGVVSKKARPEAADPLAGAGAANAGPQDKAKRKAAPGIPATGTYHYTFKLQSFDGTPLAASYYPSKAGTNGPVVMLIHEAGAGRSRKDFEDAVTDLKGVGLAEHLQDEGYAVFSMDLRGQGQNQRRALNASDRQLIVEDLQAAYQFLVDRHNRGDFNLDKLGVIALGEGANLVSAWTYQPGAAVSTEGRPSDINALVLISPMPEGAGYLLGHLLASLAPRVPLALLSGDKDNASKDAVQSVRRLLERTRLNKVELFPSSLHGYKLLRLEPKVIPTIVRFLESTLKLRPSEWEPRYNLIPVTSSDIETARHTRSSEKDAAAKKDQARKADEPKAKPEAKDAEAKKPAEKAAPQPPAGVEKPE